MRRLVGQGGRRGVEEAGSTQSHMEGLQALSSHHRVHGFKHMHSWFKSKA